MSEQATKYLLIGGGLASLNAAIGIREHDKEGSVLIVCGENHPPYDRPPISKNALIKDGFADDDAYSKFDVFYPDNKIDLLIGTRVKSIDRAERRVELENGDTVTYEKALIATGSRPRGCDMPGCDLPGVFFLRSIDDARHLREALQRHPHVAIVGAGYMGVEVAAACITRGLTTTVIAPGDQAWPLFASESLGHFVKHRLEQEGVRFVLGHEVIGVAGSAHAEGVVTSNGTSPAQCVVVCVGSTLNSELASEAGLRLAEDGGIVADSHLRTADQNIWTAGDVANFEDKALGTQWHAEHHLHARWTGRAAGENMAGASAPYDKVAYFYTDFLDIHMVQRGHPEPDSQSAFYGNVKAGEFVEVYYNDLGIVRMGVAISHDEPKLDPQGDTIEAMIREGRSIRDVRASEFGF